MVLTQSEKEKIIAHFLSLPVAEIDELEEDKKIADKAEILEVIEITYGILTGLVRGEWTHKENGYMYSIVLEQRKGDFLRLPSREKNSDYIVKARRNLESCAMDNLVSTLNLLFNEKPFNISDEVYAIFETTIENILHPPVKEKKISKAKLVQQSKDEFITLATAYIKTKISEKRFNTLEGINDFEKVDNWLKEREIKNSVMEEPIEVTNKKMDIF